MAGMSKCVGRFSVCFKDGVLQAAFHMKGQPCFFSTFYKGPNPIHDSAPTVGIKLPHKNFVETHLDYSTGVLLGSLKQSECSQPFLSGVEVVTLLA